jgi:hypothetical protein
MCFGIFFFFFAEPRFKRFHHIWKRSKKSQTPQQIRKVREYIKHVDSSFVMSREFMSPGFALAALLRDGG